MFTVGPKVVGGANGNGMQSVGVRNRILSGVPRAYRLRYQKVQAQSAAPLAFSRPDGYNRRALLSVAGMEKHAFVFNREACADDLGNIAPQRIDGFDALEYRRDDGLWVSKRNPRFLLADIDRIDDRAVTAMMGLEKAFVMRTTLHGNPMSVYLMDHHTWALWGWVEAAARGELLSEGNALIHIDDHEDLGITRKLEDLRIAHDGLDQHNVREVIEAYACGPGDPLGISSFIGPAGVLGFVDLYAWIYGYGPHAPQWEDSHRYRGGTSRIFTGGARRWRYRYFPFQRYEEMARPGAVPARILDIDIDVSVTVDNLCSIVRPHIARKGWAHCITIAISPQFGTKENHLRKVMALVKMIRACA